MFFVRYFLREILRDINDTTYFVSISFFSFTSKSEAMIVLFKYKRKRCHRFYLHSFTGLQSFFFFSVEFGGVHHLRRNFQNSGCHCDLSIPSRAFSTTRPAQELQWHRRRFTENL